MTEQRETISAIATAPGAGGIGIVRMSGEHALDVAARVFVAANGRDLRRAEPYRALYGHVVDGDTVADEAVALVMRAPHSYTREDVVELQCHGGSLVLQTVLALTYRHGARAAEPGEFTQRAFLNGRLDLSQATAVMDVIAAKSRASLSLATGRLAGAMSGTVRAWERELLAWLAHIEATIDYPEDDLDELLLADLDRNLARLMGKVAEVAATADYGRVLREGLLTALVGRPNVGKSSLLNALLREDRAIVTATPGTTRDTIEEYANVAGVPLRLIDTAGIRQSGDEVERLGMERARAAMSRARLVLLLLDSSQPLTADDEAIFDTLPAGNVLVLLTKSDLPSRLARAEVAQRLPGRELLALSVLTGDGMPELERAIVARARGSVRADTAVVVTARESQLLADVLAHLAAARRTIADGLPPDFVTIDLRSALERLGEVTGSNVAESVIGEIFRRFCVGK